MQIPASVTAAEVASALVVLGFAAEEIDRIRVADVSLRDHVVTIEVVELDGNGHPDPGMLGSYTVPIGG